MPQSTDLDLGSLISTIQTTPWFNTLGLPYPKVQHVISVESEEWIRFNEAATAAEFGLQQHETALNAYPFSDFDWLPTSNTGFDPNSYWGNQDSGVKLFCSIMPPMPPNSLHRFQKVRNMRDKHPQ